MADAVKNLPILLMQRRSGDIVVPTTHVFLGLVGPKLSLQSTRIVPTNLKIFVERCLLWLCSR